MNARYRPVKLAVAALAAVWLLALGGYAWSEHLKMTPDKLRAYIASLNFSKLSGADRAKAIHDLADKINSLSADDRRQSRIDRLWNSLFNEMTEEERAQFIDETMPEGFHQMLLAFEQQPADQRQRAINNALKRIREERDNPQAKPGQNPDPNDTNAPPVLSPELQQRVITIGLNSVYSASSAETKAELAPVMEEIQKNMELGRFPRGGH